MNYDNTSNSSASTATSIREIISGSPHNETEILRIPNDQLQQLDTEFLNRLETIPVTPEAPWDRRGEVLLRVWMDEAQTTSKKHRNTAYNLKRSYRILSISVILSTGLVFTATSLFPCTAEGAYLYIKVFVSFVSLVVANLASFYDYGPKYQSHFQYEGYYTRYAIEIQELLATDTDFRPPKDKTIVEFRERMGNLVTSAPEL